MKKFVMAGLALAALSAPAFAADMPVKAPMAPVAAPISWTGLYLGAHGGVAWTKANWTSDFNCAVGTLCDSINNSISGGVFGGQLGYRYQINQFVLGVEGTLAWSGLRGTQSGLSCTPGVGGCGSLSGSPNFLSYSSKIDRLATVTGQLGYAWDHSLLYGKGGWANARVTRNLLEFPAAGTDGTGDLSQNANGWTVGAGWEYMWTPNFTIGLEYNFISVAASAVTSNTVTTGALGSFPTTQSSARFNIHEALVRANYRFDWLR